MIDYLPFTYAGSVAPDEFNCAGSEDGLASCPEVSGETCTQSSSAVQIACYSSGEF